MSQAVSAAVYNADNQLTQWGAVPLSYDLNGNLVNDRTNVYSSNARNQLVSILRRVHSVAEVSGR